MADLVNVAPGQCRLVVTSSSLLTLERHAGAYIPLKIGAAWEAKLIPSSAPTLANTGLTAATLYYIYAFDNAGTLTLEASTTGHAADADTGVRIKTGDASRTLIGMVYMGAGTPGTFIDSAVDRLCLNWFNRSSLDMLNVFSADRSTSSTSFTEINTEIRLRFLTWADESVLASINGTHTSSAAGNAAYSGVAFDSTTVPTASSGFTSAPGAVTRGAIGVSLNKRLSEGFHFATIVGAVSGGNGEWVTADDLGTGKIHTTFFASVRG